MIRILGLVKVGLKLILLSLLFNLLSLILFIAPTIFYKMTSASFKYLYAPRLS